VSGGRGRGKGLNGVGERGRGLVAGGWGH